MRGGGWADNPHYLRVDTRANVTDDTRDQQISIRVARDLDP
jgi:formylglycine-generating enzyme required for sulfatase activity